MGESLAVQLYMVRDYLNTPKRAEEALKVIRESGCNSVEMVGFLDDNKIPWKKLLSDFDLSCCSSHERYPAMLENFPNIITRMQSLECRNVVIAMPTNIDFGQMDQVKTFADQLNHLGNQYKSEGLHLHYHNHGMEFAKPTDNGCALQYLVENTDPALVHFQPDIFWIQLGGASPESWVGRLRGRAPSIHLKDFVIAGGDIAGQDRPPVCTELGKGNLPIKSIIDAARLAGTETYILEVHDNWIRNNPLESIQVCAEYYWEICQNSVSMERD